MNHLPKNRLSFIKQFEKMNNFGVIYENLNLSDVVWSKRTCVVNHRENLDSIQLRER